MKHALKTVALAGVIGVGLAASGVAPAFARYTTTRCNGDGCRIVRCDNDGDDCNTIGYRPYYAPRPYRYERGPRWDYEYYRYPPRYHHPRRHRVCDWSGHDCYWTY